MTVGVELPALGQPEIEADSDWGCGEALITVDRAALIHALQEMGGDSVTLKVQVDIHDDGVCSGVLGLKEISE